MSRYTTQAPRPEHFTNYPVLTRPPEDTSVELAGEIFDHFWDEEITPNTRDVSNA